MKRTLVLRNLKPQSINSMYYGTGNGYAKTSGAKDWTYEVFYQLDQEHNKKALEEIRKEYKESEHCFSISLTAFYPKSIYFTKKGTISAKTQDLTNWEKPLVDCIFLPKFFELEVPQGCENLNADDRYLVDLHSKKRPSKDEIGRIEIEIELLNLNVVNNVD